MPEAQVYLAFFVATFLFMIIPGPNVALIVANSMALGTRSGVFTVLGTCSAMVLQLILIAFGIAGAMRVLGAWLDWLRWLGVVYLLYLGIRQWRAAEVAPISAPQADVARSPYIAGLVVSLVNPQTLLFYVAYFPQFVDVQRPVAVQMILFGATFVVLALLIDGSWALAAGRARVALNANTKLRNRLSAALLLLVGLGLALVRAR